MVGLDVFAIITGEGKGAWFVFMVLMYVPVKIVFVRYGRVGFQGVFAIFWYCAGLGDGVGVL